MVEDKLHPKHLVYLKKLVSSGHSVTIFGDGNIYLSSSSDAREDAILKSELQNKEVLADQIDSFKLFCSFEPGDSIPANVDDLRNMMIKNVSARKYAKPVEKKSGKVFLSEISDVDEEVTEISDKRKYNKKS